MAQALFIVGYLVGGIIVTMMSNASEPHMQLSPRGVLVMVTLYPVVIAAVFIQSLRSRDVDG